MVSRLIHSLQNRSLFDHSVSEFEILETHISWILLTGEYAYKIKKPVNFEFVDFSSLEKRCFCCYEELRLNRRLAADLYIDVCPITGSEEAPSIGGPGPVIEYMVKMRQFDQRNLLSNLIRQKAIADHHIHSLAGRVAEFHQRIEFAGSESGYGTPEQIYRWVEQNFEQIRPLLPSRSQLDRLQSWTEHRFSRIEDLFWQRKHGAHIRECHGDLHLGNIALIDDELTIFDGIEFNPELRWIDSISEIAFLLMDLYDKNQLPMANLFLDRYLAVTGDYDGLGVLPFYLVYRALVRAKISLLSAGQTVTQHPTHSVSADYQGYLDLAMRFTRRKPAVLYITHGLAGSGKSTLAGKMARQHGVIRIRSDVERKRIFGLSAAQRTGSGPQSGIYCADATRYTYNHLNKHAEKVLKAGYSVVIDAGFLQQWQRRMFQKLARELDVEFAILDLRAPVQELRQRITDRWEKNNDPSEATLEILELQLSKQQPLTLEELACSITIEPSTQDMPDIMEKINANRQTRPFSDNHGYISQIRS